jgi:hypothetical protein
MKTHAQPHRDYGFVIGLAAGIFVGAGLTIWLAPRLAPKLRERVTDAGKRIGRRASDHYEQASGRVREAVEALTWPRAL